ncbi:hypothetical protein PBY51_013151 [Eleginops maclovinus]|uniref:Uncharacterized protein n=1 Tax=Eleginops maclovinus TaxID=56733 RepID=A0AAN7XYH0_ELEMC|nr:hypothetical protein PBY51_013151 [Eleginops maclovinus]
MANTFQNVKPEKPIEDIFKSKTIGHTENHLTLTSYQSNSFKPTCNFIQPARYRANTIPMLSATSSHPGDTPITAPHQPWGCTNPSAAPRSAPALDLWQLSR